MLKKLRRKFIVTMMAVFGISLVLIFSILYYTTKMSLQVREMDFLRTAVKTDAPQGENPSPQGHDSGNQPDNLPQGSAAAPQDGFIAAKPPENADLPPAPSRPDTPPAPPSGTSVLVFKKASDGSILILKNDFSAADNDAAAAYAAAIDQTGKPEGTLKSYHLRYLTDHHGPGDETVYALSSTYPQEDSLRLQLIHSLLIGCAAWAAFFFLSLFLSDRAIRPTALAWKQQQQFVADASHELKTPLTVILANADLLNQSLSDANPADRRRCTRITDEAQRMKQLIESLLFLARNDSGKLPLKKEPIDLSFLVNSSILAFEPVAFEMGKEISAHIQENVTYLGDKEKLRRLTDILLDNACKYSKAGSSITAELSASKSKFVRLSVTNEGIPLSLEEQKQVFNRFYRADPSRGRIEGYGLGLSIALSIAREHGGKLEVSSDGVGKNTFSLVLPWQS